MTEQAQPVFRFAPSPNGELHLGHAYSALLNLLMARQSGGKMLLRIEDIDTVRCTPELERQMLEDLEWLGFEWDEAPRRQSEHFDDYRDALSQLNEMGLLYVSNLSRGQIKQKVAKYEASGKIWPRDPDGSPRHPGADWERTETKPKFAGSNEKQIVRLNMAEAIDALDNTLMWKELAGETSQKYSEIEADLTPWGDVILARRDTPTSYHLSVVIDDALQKVTHVVRGKDLLHSTSVHRLLQTLLDLDEPIYHHHDLVLDTQGNKLSKSSRSTSIRQLREVGNMQSEIWNKIGLAKLS